MRARPCWVTRKPQGTKRWIEQRWVAGPGGARAFEHRRGRRTAGGGGHGLGKRGSQALDQRRVVLPLAPLQPGQQPRAPQHVLQERVQPPPACAHAWLSTPTRATTPLVATTDANAGGL